MIVQIESVAHPCLFERNLNKAVAVVVALSLAIELMCDILFKPCKNVASFRKIRASALSGLGEESNSVLCI